jgi:hypothetical protein
VNVMILGWLCLLSITAIMRSRNSDDSRAGVSTVVSLDHLTKVTVVALKREMIHLRLCWLLGACTACLPTEFAYARSLTVNFF